jgi:hypothetical protein
VTVPEDDQEISPIVRWRNFLQTETARECINEYSEGVDEVMATSVSGTTLNYILTDRTTLELMSVFNCIVYMLIKRKSLNKNATHTDWEEFSSELTSE